MFRVLVYPPILSIILSINSCTEDQEKLNQIGPEIEILAEEELQVFTLDLDSLFDSHEVEGSFILMNLENNQQLIFNEAEVHTPITPASTFKICNSIIALETGVVADENFVIEWDGETRRIPSWNQDTDLKMALRNSTVWYYQEVARRIGKEKMRHWLDKLDYGNKNIGEEIDQFWLNGDIQISPIEQMNFLKSVVKRTLDVSDRTFDILDKIMIYDQTDDYTIRAKTGWGYINNEDIGWFVGWIETNSDKYIFVNNIKTLKANDEFGKARIHIVYEVLEQEGLLKRL